MNFYGPKKPILTSAYDLVQYLFLRFIKNSRSLQKTSIKYLTKCSIALMLSQIYLDLFIYCIWIQHYKRILMNTFKIFTCICRFAVRLNYVNLYIIFFIDEEPDGVVLESPFNNIRDAAIRHPFTAVCTCISYQ